MTASQGEMVEGLAWREAWRQARGHGEWGEKDTNRKRILFVLFVNGAGNHGVKVWQRAPATPPQGGHDTDCPLPSFLTQKSSSMTSSLSLPPASFHT